MSSLQLWYTSLFPILKSSYLQSLYQGIFFPLQGKKNPRLIYDLWTKQVRAAEDILSLTRSMKETWLFGKLDTLGEDERDAKRREETEQNADAVKSTIEGGGFLKAASKE